MQGEAIIWPLMTEKGWLVLQHCGGWPILYAYEETPTVTRWENLTSSFKQGTASEMRSGIRWSIQYVIQHCRCTSSDTFSEVWFPMAWLHNQYMYVLSDLRKGLESIMLIHTFSNQMVQSITGPGATCWSWYVDGNSYNTVSQSKDWIF